MSYSILIDQVLINTKTQKALNCGYSKEMIEGCFSSSELSKS